MSATAAAAPSGQSRPTALWDTFIVDQKRLKRALLERGWTIADWAKAASISQTTAGRFLRELPVAPKTAFALIKALGLPPADVILDRHD